MKINRITSLTIGIILLIIEIIIAVFVHDKFIRPYLGDFIAVLMVYFFVRSLTDKKPILIGIITLTIAFALEIGQYIHILKILGLYDYKILRIVLGSTFEWSDLVMYFLGGMAAIALDKTLLHNS